MIIEASVTIDLGEFDKKNITSEDVIHKIQKECKDNLRNFTFLEREKMEKAMTKNKGNLNILLDKYKGLD